MEVDPAVGSQARSQTCKLRRSTNTRTTVRWSGNQVVEDVEPIRRESLIRSGLEANARAREGGRLRESNYPLLSVMHCMTNVQLLPWATHIDLPLTLREDIRNRVLPVMANRCVQRLESRRRRSESVAYPPGLHLAYSVFHSVRGMWKTLLRLILEHWTASRAMRIREFVPHRPVGRRKGLVRRLLHCPSRYSHQRTIDISLRRRQSRVHGRSQLKS